MANILSEILQIDAVAQKKLDDAARLKEQYERETRQNMEQITERVWEEARNEISRARRREELAAQLERDALSRRRELAFEQLEQAFAGEREKLEQSLYLGALGLEPASRERN